ncbi:MAG: CarD family transcriptional regulator, partial [Spirochaetota bacterium]
IYIGATDMTVMLPVEKVNELGLRAIVPKEDAEKALLSMSDKNEPLTSDWKLRYQNNLDLLKEGGVMDIATVVRSLYHRSKVKELPILERKLYDNALKLMVDEVSLALEREKQEIEDLLHTRLENSHN